MDQGKQREQTRLRVERYRQNRQALPMDVQRSIERLSDSPEEKSRRTSIAVSYQRSHPGSQHKGIDYEAEPRDLTKPGDPGYQAHTEHEEYCDECDITLLRLEQPRRYPAKCLSCVMKGAA